MKIYNRSKLAGMRDFLICSRSSIRFRTFGLAVFLSLAGLITYYALAMDIEKAPQFVVDNVSASSYEPLTPGTSWQIQLQDKIDETVLDKVKNPRKMYDIDLYDTSTETIKRLKSKGITVICYFSAGSSENFRPDYSDFPESVKGRGNGWAGEKWLDIRRLDILGSIMKGRLKLARMKGCDGVDPDNVDGYTNKTGFPLTDNQQLVYNKFIAQEAHKRGLSVGLKNDVKQVLKLEPYFDWALNEQCYQYNECRVYSSFIKKGKAVFGIEYRLSADKFCARSKQSNFDFLKKGLDLKAAPRIDCREVRDKKPGVGEKTRSNTKQLKLGVYLPDPRELKKFETNIQQKTDIFLWYQSITEHLDTATLTTIAKTDHTIQLAWEPNDPSAGEYTIEQPKYRLKNVINGSLDTKIRRLAREIRNFKYKVIFRPMSEMNGDWTTWGVGNKASGVNPVNGNKPSEYVPAWRHIYNIFAAEGAKNAIWVWAPNVDASTREASYTFNTFYPGDKYVDYIGLNGYNWGTLYKTPEWTSSWLSFAETFMYSYDFFTSKSSKPVMVCEVGSTEKGGNKAAWISDAFKKISTRFPKIKSLTWFNVNKETDWRAESSSSSIKAFRTAIKSINN